MRRLSFFFKALLDFSVAITLLIFLSPLLVLVALLILIIDGGPIFFIQERPGLRGKIFKIIKFKTMRQLKDGQKLADNQRVTALGNLIRKSSIDELPQLINILKGELSLVGPRPLLVEYLPLYTKHQMKRHDVKPGITGWAQINGRNAISWEKKFEYDLWYVENWSFYLDLKIIFLTAMKILKTKDINASSSITMEKFKGSQ